MFHEDTLSPRRTHKRLAFNNARHERQSAWDEESKPHASRAQYTRPRPATKRTLHHLVKFWQNVSDDYWEFLETEPESQWDARLLKSR